ncbi:MAG TPA: hypothetical protein VNJ29_01075 [Candidatus Nitrosotenuis sp.]|nr:hypothetical protein [Candidatus Nitrosotenuis sp.]
MKKPIFITTLSTTIATLDQPRAVEINSPSLQATPSTDVLAIEVNPLSFQAIHPADILSDDQSITIAGDGTEIRKGTVKATIENIKILNELFCLPFTQHRHQKIVEILSVVDELLRPLHHIELFNFFTPLEWLQDTNNQGRILVTLRYLAFFKDRITPEIKHRLYLLDECCQPEVRQNIHELLT